MSIAFEGHHYRHRKGGEYVVVTIAVHTETGEEMVVYVDAKDASKVWVRPRAMFESDGRFQDLDDKNRCDRPGGSCMVKAMPESVLSVSSRTKDLPDTYLSFERSRALQNLERPEWNETYREELRLWIEATTQELARRTEQRELNAKSRIIRLRESVQRDELCLDAINSIQTYGPLHPGPMDTRREIHHLIEGLDEVKSGHDADFATAIEEHLEINHPSKWPAIFAWMSINTIAVDIAAMAMVHIWLESEKGLAATIANQRAKLSRLEKDHVLDPAALVTYFSETATCVLACDTLLRSVDVDQVDENALVAILLGTRVRKGDLPSRVDFSARARVRLIGLLGAERVEKLWGQLG